MIHPRFRRPRCANATVCSLGLLAALTCELAWVNDLECRMRSAIETARAPGAQPRVRLDKPGSHALPNACLHAVLRDRQP